MAYNTGNPIGSADPRDLYDNAQNLDEAVNGDADSFTDRMGKARPTLKGAIDPTGLATSAAQDADRAEAARDAAFVNADVYDDVATGRDSVADGEQFQVIQDDEIVRYRRIDASNEEEVARYPSVQLSRDLARVGHYNALVINSPNQIMTPSVSSKTLLGWYSSSAATIASLVGEAGDVIQLISDDNSIKSLFYSIPVAEGVTELSYHLRVVSNTIPGCRLYIEQSSKFGEYLTLSSGDETASVVIENIPESEAAFDVVSGTVPVASGTKTIVIRVRTGGSPGKIQITEPMISFGNDARYREPSSPAYVSGSESRYSLINKSAPLGYAVDAWPLDMEKTFFSSWRPWLKPSPAATCFDISRSRLWQDYGMTTPSDLGDSVRVIEDAISGRPHYVLGDAITLVEGNNGAKGLRFLGNSRIDTGLPGFESTTADVNLVVAYEPESSEISVVVTSDGLASRDSTSARILANLTGMSSVVAGGQFTGNDFQQSDITVIQSAFTKGGAGRVYVGSAPASPISVGEMGYDYASGTVSVGARPADSFRGDGISAGFVGTIYYYYASHDNPSDADARFHNRYAMYRAGVLESSDVTPISSGSFLYSSSIDTIGDLYAAYSYPSGKRGIPIVVVMHGYTGAAADMTPFVNNDMAEYGFFSLAVGMRGRDGASGSPDVGGREIYDIIDAVEYVKENFTGIVDPDNIHISGYSGGGGNVMSAAAKFPDYFTVKASHFGISDYGYDELESWGELSTSRQSSLADWIGYRPREDWDGTAPVNLDAYRSRNTLEGIPTAALGGHLFLYHDAQDDNTQPSLTTRLADAMDAAGNDRYSISLTDTGDPVRWLHNRPLENEPVRHTRSEWGMAILTRKYLPWKMPTFGTVRVIGYMRTKEFEIWLGNGQEAVANLTYDVYAGTFEVTLLTSADQLVTVTREDLSGSATVSPGVSTTITIS